MEDDYAVAVSDASPPLRPSQQLPPEAHLLALCLWFLLSPTFPAQVDAGPLGSGALLVSGRQASQTGRRLHIFLGKHLLAINTLDRATSPSTTLS